MGRKRALSIAALAVMAAGWLAMAIPAPAQTTTTTTTTAYTGGACRPLSGTQDAGTVQVGQRFNLTAAPQCAFTPGANVRGTVNGVFVGNKRADASGRVVFDITALSTSTLRVDDPVDVPARCGSDRNTAVATGPSSVAGADVTQTILFTLDCTTGTTVAAARGRVALTGANVLRFGAVAVALLLVGGVFVASSRLRHSDR